MENQKNETYVINISYNDYGAAGTTFNAQGIDDKKNIEKKITFETFIIKNNWYFGQNSMIFIDFHWFSWNIADFENM